MKNMKLKIIITAFFAVLMITVCAIPCFAQFDMTGHYDPNGTTSTYYAYPSGECNRTINVSMYDLNGNFLKKVVIKTKYGEDNSFHIGIGGYDIVNFSSNQSILETCQLVWTSGTGLCTEYCMLTVSFGEFIGMKNCAYIDSNNCDFTAQLLEQGMAKPTGFTKHSGFCEYPLWEFDEQSLKDMGAENYEKYNTAYEQYMSEFASEDPEDIDEDDSFDMTM